MNSKLHFDKLHLDLDKLQANAARMKKKSDFFFYLSTVGLIFSGLSFAFSMIALWQYCHQ